MSSRLAQFRSSLLEWWSQTPLHQKPPWDFRTQYRVVNSLIFFLWLVRIGSPAAWLLSLFQVKDREGRTHSSAWPTEAYVIAVHAGILLALVFAPFIFLKSTIIATIATILIIEICQYHIYLMIVRPVIDKAYTQYNFARTMILTIVSYQGLASLFAIIYLAKFGDSFNLPSGVSELTATSAWAVSAGILTGSGFSGISPVPGSLASVIAGIESFVGILFLTAILGLALSRASAKAIDVGMVRGPHLVDAHAVRDALRASGKGYAIDRLQELLQVDLWVTGGWLRSFALGKGNNYDGDVDILVSDLSNEELALRLTERNIKFGRGRLGGFKLTPLPNVKVDCFSTRAFGPSVSVQESFNFFNATINAAAFKYSDPSVIFSHTLFEHDATKRLLRIMPDGLLRQAPADRCKSLAATLHLLIRDNLALVPDPSLRAMVKELAGLENFMYACTFIANMLEQNNRSHEAEIIREWLR
jgi:hypothetical protein